MTLAAFLVSRRPVHPEHAEHFAAHRTIRLEPRDMARTTIVIRCGRVRRWRVVAAMALMRLAGVVGGFRSVRLAQDR